MSAPKHTPGPWRINGIQENSGSITIGAPEQRIVIADVHNAASFGDFISAAMRGRRDFGAPDTATTQMANADLIAAAPDLFDALEPDILDAIASEIDCFEHSARAASLRGIAKRQRVALAKAGAQ